MERYVTTETYQKTLPGQYEGAPMKVVAFQPSLRSGILLFEAEGKAMSPKEKLQKIDALAKELAQDHRRKTKRPRTSPLEMVQIVLAWQRAVDSHGILESVAGEIKATWEFDDFALFMRAIQVIADVDCSIMNQRLYDQVSLEAEKQWYVKDAAA